MLLLLAALSTRRGFGSASRRGRAQGWVRRRRWRRRQRTRLVSAEAVAEAATDEAAGRRWRRRPPRPIGRPWQLALMRRPASAFAALIGDTLEGRRRGA